MGQYESKKLGPIDTLCVAIVYRKPDWYYCDLRQRNLSYGSPDKSALQTTEARSNVTLNSRGTQSTCKANNWQATTLCDERPNLSLTIFWQLCQTFLESTQSQELREDVRSFAYTADATMTAVQGCTTVSSTPKRSSRQQLSQIFQNLEHYNMQFLEKCIYFSNCSSQEDALSLLEVSDTGSC